MCVAVAQLEFAQTINATVQVPGCDPPLLISLRNRRSLGSKGIYVTWGEGGLSEAKAG